MSLVPDVLADLAAGDHRGVVVDSPPGAGKSALVVRVATHLACAGERRYGGEVGDRHRGGVAVGDRGRGVPDRSDTLLRVAPRFARALFVGDPGQLDPFSTVETERWAGLTWDPMQSAVAVLLRHNPGLPVHRLPVSWRPPASAAPVVAEAFYPFTGFTSGTWDGERSLSFATRGFGGGAVDAALQTAAESGWAMYELPARRTVRTDGEAVRTCASLASRRWSAARWRSRSGGPRAGR